MSIVIGIVTNKCALVASDGRLHSGAYYENDLRVKDSEVICDNFDKTFVLDNNKLIGVAAGTMKFDNKSIEEHLKELFQSEQYSPDTLIDSLCEGLKKRIENISPSEIAFAFRKLDLILINSSPGKKKDIKIQACRFYPNSDNSSIEIKKSEIFPKDGNVEWQLFGDDSSQKKINDFLETKIKKLTNINKKTLRSLLYKAIRRGIKASEQSKEGNNFNCGGKVFVKSIY